LLDESLGLLVEAELSVDPVVEIRPPLVSLKQSVLLRGEQLSLSGWGDWGVSSLGGSIGRGDWSILESSSLDKSTSWGE
jgi:hypothetical protein